MNSAPRQVLVFYSRMQFTKPPLPIPDQITLLESRGLHFDDKGEAAHILSNISYYRLRAYMMPLQRDNDPTHTFLPNTTFRQIVEYYIFDRKLRLLIFDAIERIEIALRTQIIYTYSNTYGAWWFEDPSLYSNNYNYSKDLAKLDEELDRSSEVFIDHYNNKYTTPQRPPAWMSLEVSSMGLLSKIYRDLKICPAKKSVSAYFGLGHPKILESWMQSISYVRNICAHHSRLFNRVLTLKPTYPTNTANPWLTDGKFHHAKIYGFMSCVLYMLKIVQPQTDFPERLKQLMQEHPVAKPHQMGMSINWMNEVLWQ